MQVGKVLRWLPPNLKTTYIYLVYVPPSTWSEVLLADKKSPGDLLELCLIFLNAFLHVRLLNPAAIFPSKSKQK